MARVLLVEDDELVREATAELIRELGHQVVEADSAESARTCLHRTDFDVLVVDVGLPGLQGDVFAAEARAIRGGLRIVFATGRADFPTVIDGARNPLLLRKPFDLEALAAALADAP